MKNTRPHGNAVLETRVGYVESKLDDTIKDFKEAMLQMENRHQANFQQMEARHKESRADLKELIEKSEVRTAEMLKDSRTSRNWTITTCIAVLVLATTIASGIVGQILAAIIGN